MTIGTSAPPTGSTNSTPTSSATTRAAEQQHAASTGAVARVDARTATASATRRGERAAEERTGRPGSVTGPAGHQLLQLGEGDARAGERHRADQHGERAGGRATARDAGARSAGQPGAAGSSSSGDQRGRAAADAVEQRDQLRHLRSSAPAARAGTPSAVPTTIAARISGDVVQVAGEERDHAPRATAPRRRSGCRAGRSRARTGP